MLAFGAIWPISINAPAQKHTSAIQEAHLNDNLSNITRTLHSLVKALPAIRQHASRDAVGRHVALIQHFQGRYDRLAERKRNTAR